MYRLHVSNWSYTYASDQGVHSLFIQCFIQIFKIIIIKIIIIIIIIIIINNNGNYHRQSLNTEMD